MTGEIRPTWTETCPIATFDHHRFRMNYCGSKPSSSLLEANE